MANTERTSKVDHPTEPTDHSTAIAELSTEAKQTQVPLLAELVFDEGLDDAGLDQFILESRDLADKMALAVGEYLQK